MTGTFTYLGCSGHEPGLPGGEALLGASEDPGDAVRLGEQRRIDHSEAESRQQTRQAARQRRWLGEDREGGSVTQSHSSQNQVAEFPRRGLDDWSVVVPKEHGPCKRGGQETEAREGDGHDGLRVGPLDELGWDLVARCSTHQPLN